MIVLGGSHQTEQALLAVQVAEIERTQSAEQGHQADNHAKSPTRLTINALFAAVLALCFSK